MKKLFILTTILLFSYINVFSQPVTSKGKTFEIFFNYGSAVNTLYSSVEEAFIKAGLNETLKFFGTVNHPFSGDGMPDWNVNAGYALNDSLWLHLLGGYTRVSETSGYKASSLFFRLSVDVMNISPMLYYKYQNFKIGLGPSFFKIDTGLQNFFTFGATLDLQVQYPHDTLFFLSGNLQYRIIKSVDLGPYEAYTIGRLSSVTVPKFSAAMSHLYWGIGLGLRL